jgi:hypothetical protein
MPLGTLHPRLAKILVDDVNALARSAEADAAVDEAILQRGAFLVLATPRLRAPSVQHSHTRA